MPRKRKLNDGGEGPDSMPSAGLEGGMDQVDEPRRVGPRACEEPGCLNKFPIYAFRGEGKRGRFCSKHKHPGMINVVSKKCAQAGCSRLRHGRSAALRERGRAESRLVAAGTHTVNH